MDNLTIFDFMYEKYKLTKPIRLIELFAGYGSQALALKYLNIPFEHHLVCELDKYAMQSYNDIHNTNFEPSDITKLESLNIVDTDKYNYILTYSFPCITKDSLILTKNGYIEMEKIKVGDLVLTKSNTWQKVAKKFDNGIHQTCYLNALGFENIHCTLNHKFYVRSMFREWNNNLRTYIRKFTKPSFKEVKDIVRGDYFGIPVITIEEKPKWNGIDFVWNDGRKTRHKNEISPLLENKNFWWLIGRYIADGHITYSDKKTKGICITIGKKKIEEFKNKCIDIFNPTYCEGKSVYSIHFSSRELALFVEQFGKGAANKHLSSMILNLPISLLKEFLNGYFAGDGYNNGKYQSAISVSRILVYDLAMCVMKVYKRPVSIYKNKVKPTKIIEGRTVNQKDNYEMKFKIENSKQDKAFYEDGYIWYPYSSTTLAEKENVYNIEVENDHSYILQNCISKNCTDLSLAGKQKGMEKGSNTRSSLLWEVKRLLNECKELPQVLLMENVPQVLKAEGWLEWYSYLESKGYKNYCNILSSKDYGIPQKRERCFMVSILGNYTYQYPKKTTLKTSVKDYLEDNVTKSKFFLSEKNKDYILDIKGVRGGIQGSIVNPNIAKTISCRGACEQRANITNFVILNRDKEMTISECIECKSELNIRKLTPRECLRLMGVKDEDIDKMTVSDTQKYKQAGNSIVVNVLMAIFNEMR